MLFRDIIPNSVKLSTDPVTLERCAEILRVLVDHGFDSDSCQDIPAPGVPGVSITRSHVKATIMVSYSSYANVKVNNVAYVNLEVRFINFSDFEVPSHMPIVDFIEWSSLTFKHEGNTLLNHLEAIEELESEGLFLGDIPFPTARENGKMVQVVGGQLPDEFAKRDLRVV